MQHERREARGLVVSEDGVSQTGLARGGRSAQHQHAPLSGHVHGRPEHPRLHEHLLVTVHSQSTLV